MIAHGWITPSAAYFIQRTALLAWLCLAPGVALRAADSDKQVVILITSKASYRAAADAAADQLRSQGVEAELLVLSTKDAQARRERFDKLRKTPPDVIIAGGARLTSEALAASPNSPVVFMMTPNALDSGFLNAGSKHGGRVAGVPSDVNPKQQIEWIRKTAPDAKRVAVLCSSRSHVTAQALRDAAVRVGVSIVPLTANRDKFPAAIDSLSQGDYDGVLMIPDSQVYNAPNVERLLLWGLRTKRPIWSFSGKVVKAGAFAAVFVDPKDVGVEAARIACEIIRGKKPEQIGLRYSARLQQAVNSRTAEMVGVSFDSALLTQRTTQYGGDD